MTLKEIFAEFQPITVNEIIVLRQVNPEQDCEKYFEIYSDADALKYYLGYGKPPANLEQAKKIIQNQINAFEKCREYNWTIADRNTDEVLGRIILSDLQNNNTAANIGYFLDRKYWNKGIMTECVRAVVKFGFESLELERIFTSVEPNNIASIKVLEKNGFTKEGHLRHCFPLNDGLHDCLIYGKLFTD